MSKKIILGLAVAAIALAGAAIAQQASIKRTPLQKVDFPAGYNTITAIARFPPAAQPAATPIPAPRQAMCWRANWNC
jgi:hypothetical protein